MNLPIHYNWNQLSQALGQFLILTSDEKPVRFVISEHVYSSGYWIEDDSKPFEDSSYDFKFTDINKLLVFLHKYNYVNLEKQLNLG